MINFTCVEEQEDNANKKVRFNMNPTQKSSLKELNFNWLNYKSEYGDDYDPSFYVPVSPSFVAHNQLGVDNMSRFNDGTDNRSIFLDLNFPMTPISNGNSFGVQAREMTDEGIIYQNLSFYF